MPRPSAIVAAVLLAATIVAGACDIGGCPAALLTGVLAREGDELVVVNGDSVPAEHLRWPSGHRLEERDGRLVVVDFSGTVKAGEGDSVRLGGGEVTGVWVVCGLLEVDRPAG